MGGLVDIAKNGNKGSGPVLMDRTESLAKLWSHAIAHNGARKDEVVTAGAVDAAVTVCSFMMTNCGMSFCTSTSSQINAT